MAAITFDQSYPLTDWTANKPGVNPHIQDILDRGQTATLEERSIAEAYLSKQVGIQQARKLNPLASGRKIAKNLRAVEAQALAAGYPEVAAQCQAELNKMGKDVDRGVLSALTRTFRPFSS